MIVIESLIHDTLLKDVGVYSSKKSFSQKKLIH